jgi:dihydropyrimidinase
VWRRGCRILFSEGVVKKRIDLSYFMRITATNHAKAYGLYPSKGSVTIGADADIAIWDPTITRTIRHADPHDGGDYTPYQGIELTGWPITTIVRGRVAVRDSVPKAEKGAGSFLKRGKSAFVPD